MLKSVSGDAIGGMTTGDRLLTQVLGPGREVRPVTTAIAPSAPLSAIDRCDRCGAQAYLRVLLVAGGELLFCAHHAREHGDKLREVAAEFQDETHKLGDVPAIPANDEA
jgi:hypothetical protein